jgi:hypothetical protein
MRLYTEINIVDVLVIINIVGYNLQWNSIANLKRLENTILGKS